MYAAPVMAGYLPPLPTIRAFLAIAAQGRFNRAAESLGLTESAVSHQLRKLEEGLGVRLLERKPDGIALTEAGLRFQEKAERAMRLLSDAVEDVKSIQFGKVSITLARALAVHWLVPRYAGLHAAHPEIELQLLPTTRLCDLAREHIDLGIRYGDGVWPGLKATHLIEEVCFPVATPTLAKEWRQAGWEGFRSKARIIVNGTHPDEWSVWCAHSGWIRPDQRRGSTLESFDFVLQAGLAGAGLIMGRRPMVDDYLTRGELEAPFGTVGMVGKSYFLVWPADRLPNVRTRAVIDWLLDCAAKTAKA
jgi:LysR family transcriptional regulator, glycine cleavage system transcriptional activator